MVKSPRVYNHLLHHISDWIVSDYFFCLAYMYNDGNRMFLLNRQTPEYEKNKNY